MASERPTHGDARREGRKLTAAELRAVQPPKRGRVYISVGGVAGLSLVVTAANQRTWALQYRVRGAGRGAAPVRYVMGTADELSLADARRMAERLRGEIAEGGNPAETRRSALRAAREIPRMKAAVAEWLDGHVRDKRRPETLRQYRRLWETHARGHLGSLLVTEVSVQHLDTLHRRLKSKKTTANRLLAALGSFFGWAEKRRLIPLGANPARGVERYSEEMRDRQLSQEELARLGAALVKAEREGLPPSDRLRAKGTKSIHRPKSASKPIPADPFAVAAIRLALLSGMRIGEVCTLRWDAIDSQNGVVTLSETKTGRSVRPIGAAALLVLEDLPRLAGPYVFPSSRRGFGRQSADIDSTRPIGPPRRLWEALREEAKLKDVRVHDLRHSFGNEAANAGNSLILIAALLGHSQTRTTERYARTRRDVRQQAADTVAENLRAAIARVGDVAITELRKPAATRRR